MPRLLLSILLLVALCPATQAQEVLWSVDFNTVLNNREGGDPLCPDHTFVFTRLAPEVGLTLDEGRNSIMGGVAWFQPMNDHCTGYKVLPTVYYRFNNDRFNVELGMFPRAHMRERLPRYLWSDSLNYCQPNVRGAMFQWQHQRGGWLQAVFDWRLMQTETRREAFNFTLSGAVPVYKHLWAEGHLYYNHLAKRKNAPEDEGVIDDATVNPMLALHTALGNTALNIRAGAIIQFQQLRKEHRWRKPAAFTSTVNAQWRWLEIEESFTAGKNLFPHYYRFGSELNLGDPYYCSKVYSRTDLTVHAVRNNFVDLTATLTYHASDRCTGFWQQVACRFYIDSSIWKNKSEKRPPLKSLF
ncbi:MAG: hypothetical protein J6S96_04685 [Muribaculaceae bacterium]|nr:hypothetical protein [Muribaculaceae bacterium]